MSYVSHIARPAQSRAKLPRLLDLFALARQRRALAKLDAAQLRDIGVDRAEADIEASRPVWDVPSHWRQ